MFFCFHSAHSGKLSMFSLIFLPYFLLCFYHIFTTHFFLQFCTNFCHAFTIFLPHFYPDFVTTLFGRLADDGRSKGMLTMGRYPDKLLD